MEVVKTLNLKFSDEEKETLDKALKLINEFTYSAACDELECEDCPFKNLCDYNSAETVERKINNLLCE